MQCESERKAERGPLLKAEMISKLIEAMKRKVKFTTIRRAALRDGDIAPSHGSRMVDRSVVTTWQSRHGGRKSISARLVAVFHCDKAVDPSLGTARD